LSLARGQEVERLLVARITLPVGRLGHKSQAIRRGAERLRPFAQSLN
jgi:hypothetical protein